MAARKNRELKGDLNVTLQLHGWPAETRMLSVVEACWMVDLVFRAPGKSVARSLTYFQSDDYAKALAKYEALRVIYQ